MATQAVELGRTAAPGERRGRAFAVLIGIAAIAAALVTVFLLADEQLGSDPVVVYGLVGLNGALSLPLAFLVVRRIVRLWVDRRRGLAGSRLHVRLTLLFGTLAAAPTAVVAVFAGLFLSLGLNNWFSERVRSALDESNAVANAYLEEHRNNVRSVIIAMRNELNFAGPFVLNDPQILANVVANQAALGQISEAIVFNTRGQVLSRYGLTFSLELGGLPFWALERARLGEVVALNENLYEENASISAIVRALVGLERFGDVFLLVGRYVDQRVVDHVERHREATASYANIEQRLFGLQVSFALIFLLVALLLVLAAVWGGLVVATRLIQPIGGLIAAAERIRAGDLSVRLGEEANDDELGLLARAFNRMTNQLEAQRGALVAANRALDDRRRFTEAVLSGVSAGVVGLDAGGHVNLPNRSASTLLGVDFDARIGAPFAEVVPEMAPLLDRARASPDRTVHDEITVQRDGRSRRFLVRVAAERVQEGTIGFVVTFDDITDLELAQRKAAWADVARRIAHEIKNPLTPIQLSAERLKRKYLSEIRSDPDTFRICTETIVRQVRDIGRMVDEFSSFARMPVPVMQNEDLRQIVLEAVALQRHARADVAFETGIGPAPAIVSVDHRLIGQAVTNLLQNAIDAIDGRDPAPDLPPGQVGVAIETGDGAALLTVTDNGRGLPRENRDRLTEPYVTTRVKGTGLGLAIVKKVMEDHRGELRLADRPGGGAAVTLVLPLAPAAEEPAGIAAHGA